MVNLPDSNENASNLQTPQPSSLMSSAQGFWSNNLGDQQPKWYHYILMMVNPKITTKILDFSMFCWKSLFFNKKKRLY